MAGAQRISNPDWEAVRRDFPVLRQKVNDHPLVYLDNAATTQKPQSVIDAITRFYECDNANVHRGMHALANRATDAYEAGRARVAQFIGATSPAEIVFTRGTTEAINLVAQTWGQKNIGPGDVIVLTEAEHHSNLVPWQMLAAQKQAQIVYAPIVDDQGELDLAKLKEMLSPRVKLLSVVHVSNILGSINPVAEICAVARARGITTLIDAAQSVGHMPVNVAEIGCDFLAFSGHKMCGPTGIGVLFGKRELLESMPPWQGGGEMIREVGVDGVSYAEPPYRFEAGTPNIAGVIGLHAAMDYVDAIGRDCIFRHDQELAQTAFDALSSIPGIRLLGPSTRRAGLVTFALPDLHAHDLVTFADQQGIALRGGHHCTQPLTTRLALPATTRASFYLYNTAADVARLVETINEARRFLT